jgi:hypothetical protein
MIDAFDTLSVRGIRRRRKKAPGVALWSRHRQAAWLDMAFVTFTGTLGVLTTGACLANGLR